MTILFRFSTRPFSFSAKLLTAGLMTSLSLPLAAQQPPASNNVNTQREAMRKLSFLAGRWSGPATIMRGMGEPLHATQTEDVEYKLDGLVMLIEGHTTSAGGQALFSALATISFDDVSRRYRFRAYNNGHYLDTELSVPGNGFSWALTAGPAHVVNTMHLTGKGEWNEVTETAVGEHPSRRTMEMLLHRQP